MSLNPLARPFSSWLGKFSGLLGRERRPTTRRPRTARRGLRFEPLENRTLLSATVLPSISGVVYHDLTDNGLTADDVRLPGVTVNLYRDGGNGLFDNGGGDDQPPTSTTSGATGVYRFSNLQTGTYFVQQLAAPGLVLKPGQGVATVNITQADLQGAVGRVIDSFDGASQFIRATRLNGKTASASASAPEALGGHRDLFAQLGSAAGALSLGVNSDIPNMLDFAASSVSSGVCWVNWDGAATDAKTLDPTGLGQLDLTNVGASTGIKLSLGADHDNAFVRLKVYSDANNWSWAIVTLPNTSDGAASQETIIPFTSFTSGGGSGADFSKVGAVQLEVNGVSAVDGQVGPITAIGPKVFANNFANVAQTDLVVVKSDSPDPVVAGNAMNYYLTAGNYGPSDATGVTVVDTLPAGLTFLYASSTQGSVTSAGGVVTFHVGNLANGQTASATLVVKVDPSVRGSVVNTAVISGNQTDTNLANNTANEPTQVNAQTDLVIVKSDSPDPVVAGHLMNYYLTAGNYGPSNATGVTVVDTLPAGLTFLNASSTQGTVTSAGGVVTFHVGNLAPGQTAAATLVVQVAPWVHGSILNTAVVSGEQTDINLANNTANEPTQVNAQTDLVIVKSDSPDPVVAGEAMNYYLTAGNYGPSDATGVTVVDTLPAGLTFLYASSTQGSVTSAGGVVTFHVGSLATGQTAAATLVVKVDPSVRGSVVNTAVISGEQTDTNPANNTANEPTQVNALLDLAIFKNGPTDAVKPGATVTYTLTAVNNGPTAATGVIVTDTLPADVNYSSVQVSQGQANLAGKVLTISLGNLAPGASATVTIVTTLNPDLTVDPNAGYTFTNIAQISGNETETTLANNKASVTTPVDVPNIPQGDPEIDLAIRKSADPSSVAAGSLLTYRLIVDNIGQTNATGVTVTDTLPAGVTLSSIQTSQGSASNDSGVLHVYLGNLNQGSQAVITVVVSVNWTTAGTLSNTASVDGNEDETSLGDNQATVSTPVFVTPSKRRFIGR